MHAPPQRWSVLVAVLAGLLLGCATPGAPPPVGAPPPGTGVATGPNGPLDPADPNAVDPADPTIWQRLDPTARAQSALEGMVMGAVFGAQFGPIGMAAGAGTMLIYGAITGNSPLSSGGGGSAPPGGPYDPYPGGSETAREAAIENEIESELARSDALEDEIEAELRRQEELLDRIEDQEKLQTSAQAAIAPTLSEEELKRRVDPRVAPPAPADRELPLAIFDEQTVKIPKGAWGNKKKLRVVQRTLDADQDGAPEEIRYYDRKGQQLLRKEQDRDYDGNLDSWSDYQQGELSARRLDTNADGKADVWERYSGGVMTGREIDRDADGVHDAFYVYEQGSIVEERHDANNDGKPDLLVAYQSRLRVSAEEDTDRDGRIDSWTSYTAVDGEEVVARVERDTDSDGRRDVFETYEAREGRPELARREEDKDGDGEADVTSIYENGRLIRREISDPSLVPL